MVLLVTVHTERNKNIASSFTANWLFRFSVYRDIFDFFSLTAARICFKFCVDVPWVDLY